MFDLVFGKQDADFLSGHVRAISRTVTITRIGMKIFDSAGKRLGGAEVKTRSFTSVIKDACQFLPMPSMKGRQYGWVKLFKLDGAAA